MSELQPYNPNPVALDPTVVSQMGGQHGDVKYDLQSRRTEVTDQNGITTVTTEVVAHLDKKGLPAPMVPMAPIDDSVELVVTWIFVVLGILVLLLGSLALIVVLIRMIAR